jgi:pyruvate dehydrogenase E1 component
VKAVRNKKEPCVQLLGAGTILREVIAAAEILKEDYNVMLIFGALPVSMS